MTFILIIIDLSFGKLLKHLTKFVELIIIIRGELRSYISNYIYTKIRSISMLPQQDVCSSRYPTPQPFLHVKLEYHLVGRLTYTQLRKGDK